MSQILSADDLLQLKEIILEELQIINGELPGDEVQRLLFGFASKRGDYSLFEETLVRKIITGDENGKLPSEQLREVIIRNSFLSNNLNVNQEITRNSKGAIYFNKNNPSPILLTVDRSNLRFKKSKIKYIFDLNFSEFVVNINSTDELIDQLKDQIENLKNKIAVTESDKETIKTALSSVELDNSDLRNEIDELQNLLQESLIDLQDLELTTQEEIIGIQSEAQQLILDANEKLLQKETEFLAFKNKVEIIFTVSSTYEEIIENFKKIGIGI